MKHELAELREKSRRENKTATERKIISEAVQKRIMIAEATAWDMDFKI